MHTPTRNVFTVDLEDWFHFSFGGFSAPQAEWASMESRVDAPTDTLLQLLGDGGVQATFFILGWMADHHPALIRRIADAGHEIGCHTYSHPPITSLDAASFAEELRRARGALEDASGQPVRSFRAPMFSITPDMGWALATLVEEGFLFDSSIFPAKRLDGGAAGAEASPHVIETAAGPLYEFPVSVLDVGRARLPLFGGGYFRLASRWAVIAGAKVKARRGEPLMFYIHPHDLDPGQPRVVHGAMGRFRRYVGLGRAASKLKTVIDAIPFTRLDRAWGMEASGAPHPPA